MSLTEWRDAPQMSPGAATPAIAMTEHDLVVAYRTNYDDFVVLRFGGIDQVTFGYPNDEALAGHPLYAAGLRFYATYEVMNSPRIRELNQANQVAFPGSRVFPNARHWVVTFKDSTLEVVANGIRYAGTFAAESAYAAIGAHLTDEKLRG